MFNREFIVGFGTSLFRLMKLPLTEFHRKCFLIPMFKKIVKVSRELFNKLFSWGKKSETNQFAYQQLKNEWCYSFTSYILDYCQRLIFPFPYLELVTRVAKNSEFILVIEEIINRWIAAPTFPSPLL